MTARDLQNKFNAKEKRYYAKGGKMLSMLIHKDYIILCPIDSGQEAKKFNPSKLEAIESNLKSIGAILQETIKY